MYEPPTKKSRTIPKQKTQAMVMVPQSGMEGNHMQTRKAIPEPMISIQAKMRNHCRRE